MFVEALKFIRYSSVQSFNLNVIAVYCELFMWIIYVDKHTGWRYAIQEMHDTVSLYHQLN